MCKLHWKYRCPDDLHFLIFKTSTTIFMILFDADSFELRNTSQLVLNNCLKKQDSEIWTRIISTFCSRSICESRSSCLCSYLITLHCKVLCVNILLRTTEVIVMEQLRHSPFAFTVNLKQSQIDHLFYVILFFVIALHIEMLALNLNILMSAVFTTYWKNKVYCVCSLPTKRRKILCVTISMFLKKMLHNKKTVIWCTSLCTW